MGGGIVSNRLREKEREGNRGGNKNKQGETDADGWRPALVKGNDPSTEMQGARQAHVWSGTLDGFQNPIHHSHLSARTRGLGNERYRLALDCLRGQQNLPPLCTSILPCALLLSRTADFGCARGGKLQAREGFGG